MKQNPIFVQGVCQKLSISYMDTNIGKKIAPNISIVPTLKSLILSREIRQYL